MHFCLRCGCFLVDHVLFSQVLIVRKTAIGAKRPFGGDPSRAVCPQHFEHGGISGAGVCPRSIGSSRFPLVMMVCLLFCLRVEMIKRS
jgi:hypothetical protein